MRKIIERILIITPGGLTKQWQEDEMGVKFNIPFTLVNRSIFNADPTIFRSANKVVASIDFILSLIHIYSTTIIDCFTKASSI